MAWIYPQRLQEALREYQRYNELHNDLEAYLYAMGEWALGEDPEKPNKEDYGLED